MKRFSKLLCFMVVFITAIVALSAVSFAAEQQYTGNLIPQMTSNTAPSGIVTSSYSQGGSWADWHAFDHSWKWGVDSHSWCPSDLSIENWLAYEFPTPQIITKYTMVSDTNYTNVTCPENWTFEGWNGSEWVTLDTRNSVKWTPNIKQAFVFNNAVAYKKYRINIPASQKSYVIGEIEMMASIVTTPTAPINLIATGGNAKVDLSWEAVEGATSYIVKRSETPGGPYQTIATTTGSITYSDVGLVNGITYYYVVSAVNVGGESSNSNEVSATPTAPQPTNQLKLVLEVKEEKQLSVSDELSVNTEMDWTSFDPTIATVDINGMVKALKPGNTVITCTSKDKSYTESINVLVVDLDYQLAVDLTVGGTCRLTIDDLTNITNVTWSSYDPTIATVSAKGKVTAVSEGLTYIVATDKDGKEIGRIYIRVRQ